MTTVGFDVSALDPTFKSHAQRGIGRYVLELKRFFERSGPHDLAIEWFDHRSVAHAGFGARAIDYFPCGRTTLRQQLLYPWRLDSGPMQRFSFLHFPAHMDAPAWSRKPFVLTVLDLIPLVLEPLYRANRPGWRFAFARWLELRAIQNAVVLLAISEATANDIVRLLGVPRERIVVTPLGVDAAFFEVSELRRALHAEHQTHGTSAVRHRLGIPPDREILLYVGGHDERKNIAALVAIAAGVVRAQSAQRKAPPVLVLAGRISSAPEQERLNAALKAHGMAEHTCVVGYVPEEQLLALYAESAVFLFPSLYEGFGLPVLEAMAAGVAVVSADTSAIPEVLSDCGLLFDPGVPDQGVAAVLEVLRNPTLQADLGVRGQRRAREFTWDRTGKLTLQGYRYAEELLHPRGAGRLPLGAEVSR
jgi:glycosyltransferase involved in cell wall biosynthesis